MRLISVGFYRPTLESSVAILRLAGHEVAATSDLAAAVATVADHDGILLSDSIPYEDRCNAASSIRERDRKVAIFVVMRPGENHIESANRCVDFLEGPEALVKAIAGFWQEGKAQAA